MSYNGLKLKRIQGFDNIIWNQEHKPKLKVTQKE